MFRNDKTLVQNNIIDINISQVKLGKGLDIASEVDKKIFILGWNKIPILKHGHRGNEHKFRSTELEISK